jgi:hypothetical protein
MEKVKTAVSMASCLFALLSCFCWAKSASARVKYRAGNYANGTWVKVESGPEGRFDVYATAALQSKWNKFAAGTASIAAFLQTLSAYLAI